MSLQFTQVDAFSDTPFAGNPAAVMILESFPPDEFMAGIAREMNLSETAFLVPVESGRYQLRWFTPSVEVDLCGHATLASAHALFESGLVSGSKVTFSTRSGDLHVVRNPKGTLTMDFPAEPAAEKPRPANLEGVLGAPVLWYGENRMDALVQVQDPGWVRSLDPDMNALSRMAVRGLVVTARGDEDGIDFISRFFAPQSGVPEDPVTGSAHCALAPFWSKRLEQPTLTGKQVSARGGVVRVEHRGDRVLLTGSAITVIRGELLVELPEPA